MEHGSAVFDFTGTGPEVWGNINAPKAVTHSALIYSLRCLVGEDIPLKADDFKLIQNKLEIVQNLWAEKTE